MATRAMSFGARTLPKPRYTGGVPASRNASSSAGSGRSSGRIHAPVCTTSRSAGSCQGARTGSAASHGRSVMTWSRTLSTGGRPIEARWVLSGSPTKRVVVLDVQVVQHPVVGHVWWQRPAPATGAAGGAATAGSRGTFLGGVRAGAGPRETGSVRLAPLAPADWSDLRPGRTITMHKGMPRLGAATIIEGRPRTDIDTSGARNSRFAADASIGRSLPYLARSRVVL
jgi:hypothetical protein